MSAITDAEVITLETSADSTTEILGDLEDDTSDVELCSRSLRTLTEKEQEMLNRQDSRIVPSFKQNQFVAEAAKHWDLFYKRNSTKFFKDRHWTTREFKELSGAVPTAGDVLRILEVGCGVGNFLFPLLNEMKHIYFYACDFSPRAVQFVKENPQFDSTRCYPFTCDVTKDALDSIIVGSSVDLATMIFCLSAIHPDKMVDVLTNICKVLKPGGSVLLRDYGLYDHAMLRFAPGHKMMENFYLRQDGTCAYYFSIGKLEELLSAAGFQTVKAEYIFRETVNRKEGICVPRIFVQGKFTKL